MADAPDSKSGPRKGVWVQVPPSVLKIACLTSFNSVTLRPRPLPWLADRRGFSEPIPSETPPLESLLSNDERSIPESQAPAPEGGGLVAGLRAVRDHGDPDRSLAGVFRPGTPHRSLGGYCIEAPRGDVRSALRNRGSPNRSGSVFGRWLDDNTGRFVCTGCRSFSTSETRLPPTPEGCGLPP